MNDDLGWGTDADHSAWGAVGSVALLVTAGLYWSSLWLVSGLAPVPTIASRAMRRLASRQNPLVRTPFHEPGEEYAPQ